MKKLLLILIVLTFIVNQTKSQVYYKEIVYEFNYSITKNDTTVKGIMYLGCLGKPWWNKKQKQAAITWTTDKTLLDKKFISTGAYEEERIWIHPPETMNFLYWNMLLFRIYAFPFRKIRNGKGILNPASIGKISNTK